MKPMNCDEIRDGLLELLGNTLEPRKAAELQAHLDGCPSCARELQELGEAWDSLPDSIEAEPPLALRARVIGLAKAEIDQRSPSLLGVRDSVREIAGPVMAGAAGALGLITLAHFRGATAPLSQPLVVALSLALASGLALAVGGLMRARIRPPTRAVLTGSLAAFGGYVLLTAMLPISDTVHFCGLVLFGTLPLSLGQLCLTYLSVAALYAGVPMAIATYVWGGGGGGPSDDRTIGLTEGLVFTLLAVPLVLLQSGFEPWVIPLGAVIGFGFGAVAGGFAGRWTHLWVLRGAGG